MLGRDFSYVKEAGDCSEDMLHLLLSTLVLRYMVYWSIFCSLSLNLFWLLSF